MTSHALAVFVALGLFVACGGSKTAPAAVEPQAASATASPSAPGPGGATDGGTATTASGGGERPFAKSGAEASELIDKTVESRHDRVKKCIDEVRARRKDPHAKIVVELGIDQEGMLIGVKAPKGAINDDALFACVRDALRDAPFPRSHAGVITVKKSFEDVWVYPK
jgi:hypothetical protein